MKRRILLAGTIILSLISFNAHAANRANNYPPSPEQVSRESFYRGIEAAIIGVTIAGVIGAVAGANLHHTKVHAIPVRPRIVRYTENHFHYPAHQPRYHKNFRKPPRHSVYNDPHRYSHKKHRHSKHHRHYNRHSY